MRRIMALRCLYPHPHPHPPPPPQKRQKPALPSAPPALLINPLPVDSAATAVAFAAAVRVRARRPPGHLPCPVYLPRLPSLAHGPVTLLPKPPTHTIPTEAADRARSVNKIGGRRVRMTAASGWLVEMKGGRE